MGKLHHTKYKENYKKYILNLIEVDGNEKPLTTDEEKIKYINNLIREGVDTEGEARVHYGNIHKVKGLTYDNVIVDETCTRPEDYFTQLRLKYVAYSRGRVDCWTIASQDRYTLGRKYDR